MFDQILHKGHKNKFKTYPVPGETDELEEFHDPARQQRYQKVEAPHAQSDPALEVCLELGIGPIAVLESAPTVSGGEN